MRNDFRFINEYHYRYLLFVKSNHTFCHEKPVFRLVFRENQLLYVLRITFQSIVFTLFYSFYL